mmetsp:Transcript_35974/g.103372  ORF Transcript_35974/g.103372 Transcript_35974/m.103372 type:complete len:201 (-) Transcript_35974:467-1069(-)
MRCEVADQCLSHMIAELHFLEAWCIADNGHDEVGLHIAESVVDTTGCLDEQFPDGRESAGEVGRREEVVDGRRLRPELRDVSKHMDRPKAQYHLVYMAGRLQALEYQLCEEVGSGLRWRRVVIAAVARVVAAGCVPQFDAGPCELPPDWHEQLSHPALSNQMDGRHLEADGLESREATVWGRWERWQHGVRNVDGLFDGQ